MDAIGERTWVSPAARVDGGGERLSMKTLLICHDGAALDQHGLGRWLASFSELVGVIVLRESRRRVWQRMRREIRRVGPVRFWDVMAFRLYYALMLARRDRAWSARQLERLRRRYPAATTDAVPVLRSESPNTDEVRAFIGRLAPDLMIARCKTLLQEDVFSIPSHGTVVLHPGICPEYRNAHGCFWALANDDLGKVGMTLLRIDRGVDTGPTYGHYGYEYDERRESHVVIQHRVVHENLDAIRDKLVEIVAGRAAPLDVTGRPSATWGQPWLTRYLRWKYKARRRSR
jgi:hypothetical protein